MDRVLKKILVVRKSVYYRWRKPNVYGRGFSKATGGMGAGLGQNLAQRVIKNLLRVPLGKPERPYHIQAIYDEEADLLAVVLRSQIDLRFWAEYVSTGPDEAAAFSTK